MRGNDKYDLVMLQREAEKLRAQTMRKGLKALGRMIANLFSGKHFPHGGRPAGA